jgi:hypothetical protein
MPISFYRLGDLGGGEAVMSYYLIKKLPVSFGEATEQ